MKNSTQYLVLFLLLFVFNAADEITFSQVQAGSFIFEGVQRDYLVFIPQNYNGVDKLPLVFNLHGYTLSAEQQMNYSRMNQVADTAGFIVVYPNAIGTYWNCGIAATAGHVNDVGFIDALIDTLAAHYNIDEDRIYSCGFSLGGFMSYRLACQLSNRIAAIADVAGSIANSLTTSYSTVHSMPVIKFHGTLDQLIPFSAKNDWCSVQQTLDYWTNFNHCNPPDTTAIPDIDTLDGCSVQKIRYKFSSDSGEVVFYKILNGGHSWPGGDTAYFQYLSLGPIGKTDRDINASEMIWEFFKNYKLASATAVKDFTQNPMDFALLQNYPNPFNPVTSIEYRVGSTEKVTLKVYDILGKEVATLVDESQPAGSYEVEFDANKLTSGVYFYQLRAGNFVETKKMILLR